MSVAEKYSDGKSFICNRDKVQFSVCSREEKVYLFMCVCVFVCVREGEREGER